MGAPRETPVSHLPGGPTRLRPLWGPQEDALLAEASELRARSPELPRVQLPCSCAPLGPRG